MLLAALSTWDADLLVLLLLLVPSRGLPDHLVFLTALRAPPRPFVPLCECALGRLYRAGSVLQVLRLFAVAAAPGSYATAHLRVVTQAGVVLCCECCDCVQLRLPLVPCGKVHLRVSVQGWRRVADAVAMCTAAAAPVLYAKSRFRVVMQCGRRVADRLTMCASGAAHTSTHGTLG